MDDDDRESSFFLFLISQLSNASSLENVNSSETVAMDAFPVAHTPNWIASNEKLLQTIGAEKWTENQKWTRFSA